MTCTACGEHPKENTAKDFTKAVIEINNPDETLVLLRKVVIPASMGTEEQVPPVIGKYHNVILNYEANGKTYLYSSDGIPTLIYNGGNEGGDLPDYSTEESSTKQHWVDGKTIYMKTFILDRENLPPNSQVLYTAHNIANFGQLVKMEGIVELNGGFMSFINVLDVSVDSTRIKIGSRMTGTYPRTYGSLTLYYTKA